MRAAQEKRDLENKRKILIKMLSTPFMTSDFSGRYPTQTGSLVKYSVSMNLETKTELENSNSNNALSMMKKEAKDFQKLVKTVKHKRPRKKCKGVEKGKLKKKRSLANDS